MCGTWAQFSVYGPLTSLEWSHIDLRGQHSLGEWLLYKEWSWVSSTLLAIMHLSLTSAQKMCDLVTANTIDVPQTVPLLATAAYLRGRAWPKAALLSDGIAAFRAGAVTFRRLASLIAEGLHEILFDGVMPSDFARVTKARPDGRALCLTRVWSIFVRG